MPELPPVTMTTLSLIEVMIFLLRLDAGAVAALREGKSLLPVGMVEVVGHFRILAAPAAIDAVRAAVEREPG